MLEIPAIETCATQLTIDDDDEECGDNRFGADGDTLYNLEFVDVDLVTNPINVDAEDFDHIGMSPLFSQNEETDESISIVSNHEIHPTEDAGTSVLKDKLDLAAQSGPKKRKISNDAIDSIETCNSNKLDSVTIPTDVDVEDFEHIGMIPVISQIEATGSNISNDTYSQCDETISNVLNHEIHPIEDAGTSVLKDKIDRAVQSSPKDRKTSNETIDNIETCNSGGTVIRSVKKFRRQDGVGLLQIRVANLDSYLESMKRKSKEKK